MIFTCRMWTVFICRSSLLIGPTALRGAAEADGGQEMEEGRVAAGGKGIDDVLWGFIRLRRSLSTSKLLSIDNVEDERF